VPESARAQAVLRQVLQPLPQPLVAPVAATLARLINDRGAVSIIGLVTLAWGASGFYATLDTAMAILIPGGEPRSLLLRRARGLAAMLLVGAAALAIVILGATWSILSIGLASELLKLVAQWAGPPLTALTMIGGSLAIYRLVPVEPPTWRAALPPAIAAGIGIALLTTAFGLAAPLFVGSLAAFGVLVSLLAAMIWLSYAARLLVLGAIWSRVRRDLAKHRFERQANQP
jgi:uncharacterized BrkB/YihY/UPF0761 family membrane protein